MNDTPENHNYTFICHPSFLSSLSLSLCLVRYLFFYGMMIVRWAWPWWLRKMGCFGRLFFFFVVVVGAGCQATGLMVVGMETG